MLTAHPSRRALLAYYVSRYVGWPFVLLLGFDGVVAFAYVYFGVQDISLPHVPLPLFGSAIGVLVGFRNTGAYARWWEGRQLWGAIVNDSRSLARQMSSFVGQKNRELFAEIVRLQIAYAHALRLQLRQQDVAQGLTPFLSGETLAGLRGERNIALAIHRKMADRLGVAFAQGELTELTWMNLDDTLTRLMSSQGGLERIKNTPMPHQYDFLLRCFVGFYCLLLPFGMVEKLGWATPIGSSLLGLIFLIWDKLGREMEAPFENEKSDLPLTSIATTIEINLLQMIGAPRIPDAEKARDGVLW